MPNFSFENRNGNWIRTSQLIDTMNWTYILNDKRDQSLWVGLKEGILHIDKNFKPIRKYSQEEGNNNLILNMLFDKDENLWFLNLSNQIGRLNPATGIFANLLESDGYIKQDYGWYAPSAVDAQGDIYLGIGWKLGKEDPGWKLHRIFAGRYSPVS